MSRAIMPLTRKLNARSDAGNGSWRRALTGLVLLVLLMFAVSFLSGRLKGGESASRELGGGEKSVSVETGLGTAGKVDEASPNTAAREPLASVTETLEIEGSGERGTAGSFDEEVREIAPQEDSSREPPLELGSSLLKVFLGLAAVIALILTVRFVAGRSGRRRYPVGGRLEVVGYTPLSPTSGIYEVRAGNRVFMIGEADKGLSLLGEVDAEALVTTEDADVLEDEFLAVFREEMAAASGSPRSGDGERRRPLLEELRWKTARRRGSAWA